MNPYRPNPYGAHPYGGMPNPYAAMPNRYGGYSAYAGTPGPGTMYPGPVRPDLTCFRCGRNGHYANECPLTIGGRFR